MQYSEMNEFTSINIQLYTVACRTYALWSIILLQSDVTPYTKSISFSHLLHAPFSPFQQRVRHQSVHFLWLDAR